MIRIIDVRDLIETAFCAAYIFLSVKFESDDCILPDERDSSFKIFLYSPPPSALKYQQPAVLPGLNAGRKKMLNNQRLLELLILD